MKDTANCKRQYNTHNRNHGQNARLLRNGVKWWWQRAPYQVVGLASVLDMMVGGGEGDTE